VKLADLKTSSDYVRDQLAGYLNGLIELGVRGFRVDAAKHMPHQDLAAVFSRLTKQVFIYQEVIDLGGEPIQANEYFYLGRVTEFRYGRDLSRTIQSGKLADLVQFGDVWGMMPGGNALVFVDNHDNQRGHGAGGRVLTYKQGEAYALANVFMLAWPYGSAKLMSSYRFEGDNDQGPPMLKDGTTKRVYNTDDTNNCGNDWICEHRWQAIANMVGFRQATGDELRVTNWWSNGNNQIAFGRGNKGFVALNNEKYALNQTLQTSMEPGRYCNVTSGEFDKMNGLCFGEVIEVQNSGTIQLNVNPKASVAIHVGAKLP
jgi:alpha-amylase